MDDKLLQDVSAVLYEYGRDRQKLEERARQVIDICRDNKAPEYEYSPSQGERDPFLPAQLWWKSSPPPPTDLPVIAAIAATQTARSGMVVLEDFNPGTGEYSTRAGKKFHISRIQHYARIKF